MRFTSYIPYDSKRVHAAAIYCSDGRVGSQTADFLSSALGLPRYDRVCLPGGAACLAGYAESYVQRDGVVEELHFLVEAHQLERIVLIAHEGCAFYTSRLNVAQENLEDVQFDDLHRAAKFIHDITGVKNIEGYFSRIYNSGVVFEAIPALSTIV